MADEVIEVHRVDALLDKQEAFLRARFNEYVKQLTAPAIIAQVEKLVSQGKTGEVLMVPLPYIDQLANSLSDVFLTTLAAESIDLAHLFVVKAASFVDPTSEAVNALMRRNREVFKRDFTAKQIAVIRQELIAGLRAGESYKAIARRFKDVVGLTADQRASVLTYQRLLEQGSKQALQRQLRDKRFDTLVQRVIDENDVLTARQIEKMVGAYSRNMIRSRANNIAQIAGLQVVNQARAHALENMATGSEIDEQLIVSTWVDRGDGKVRHTHDVMGGQTVRMGQAFVSPSGARMRSPGDTSLGAPLSEVAGCRCRLKHTIAGSRAEASRLLTQR